MAPTAPPRPRRSLLRKALLVLCLLACAGFAALGHWQVERRRWKLDLIERVDQRVRAPAVEAPGPAQWPQISAQADEYRHVRLRGRFLPGHDSWVLASTELGRGYWLISPLQGEDGRITLVNRGFVSGRTSPETAPAEQALTGLLRLSEPGGSLLQHNDPAAGRWYSRDVQAIAQAQHLGVVAPYFVDADADGGTGSGGGAQSQSDPQQGPVGGLTVVSFHNSHLVYAITWFALALMSLGAAWLLMREDRHPDRPAGPLRASEGDPDHGPTRP